MPDPLVHPRDPDETREERFIAEIVCPRCGLKYVCAPAAIPELCGCGKRFWTPVKPGARREAGD
jgi:hypothetical protein